MPDEEKVIEKAKLMAVAMSTFHVTLLEKGVKPELADRLAESMVKEGSSTFDGHCGD